MGENGMQVNIIAACDRNGVIGVNNRLPFSIPDDLKRFRELTIGHAVIMGRNTWNSLPTRPLDKRKNIVLTSSAPSYINRFCFNEDRGWWLCSNIELALIESQIKGKAFIIGGERLYTEALPLADRVYLTLVDTEVEVWPVDTVARFPLEQMKALFRLELEDSLDGFIFTEWVKK
jgi:dihydrofolate reductase